MQDGELLSKTSQTTSLPQSSNPALSDFHLYGFWSSSSTWRVRIALSCKGIQFEYHSIDILHGENQNEDFYQNMNMMHQVPVLVCSPDYSKCDFDDELQHHHPIMISQSMAIIEFLEEAFPSTEKSLLPLDLVDRARVREIAEIVNSGVQPFQNSSVICMIDQLDKECVEWKLGNGQKIAKYHIERGLKAIECLVVKYRHDKGNTGKFMIGTSNPTLADAFVVPQLYNSRRFFIDLDAICPTLLRVESECLDHAWFMASHPDFVQARYP
jgi:maleylacetoacetate isomerase